MKKISRYLITLLLIVVLFVQVLPLNSSAVEVNSHTVVVGDIITYELHASGCPKDIQAVDVSIYYDNAALEIVEDSLELPFLSGYVVNTDLDGEIRFNAVSLDGFQFQANRILAAVKFKVISDYNPYPYLKYEIRNFIDIELIDHLETYTYDLTYVNEDFPGASDIDSDSDVVSVASTVSNDSDSEKTDSDTDSLEGSDSDNASDLNSTDSETASKDKAIDTASLTENSAAESEQGNVSVSEKKETSDVIEASDSAADAQSSVNMNVIFIVAIAIVILIAVLFVVIKKSSHTGSHMSE